ncbi:Basic proline-rich protein precursor [Enhygromyxa salina]|uniref:Basic proline-rich protein n=1 Tax=Enhygromyxa salina TaxID=215803 RepID=A0A0C2CQF4_9BACT|nr:Basic proline-rich protein precursor [Enhygromyxa salina]
MPTPIDRLPLDAAPYATLADLETTTQKIFTAKMIHAHALVTVELSPANHAPSTRNERDDIDAGPHAPTTFPAHAVPTASAVPTAPALRRQPGQDICDAPGHLSGWRRRSQVLPRASRPRRCLLAVLLDFHPRSHRPHRGPRLGRDVKAGFRRQVQHLDPTPLTVSLISLGRSGRYCGRRQPASSLQPNALSCQRIRTEAESALRVPGAEPPSRKTMSAQETREVQNPNNHGGMRAKAAPSLRKSASAVRAVGPCALRRGVTVAEHNGRRSRVSGPSTRSGHGLGGRFEGYSRPGPAPTTDSRRHETRGHFPFRSPWGSRPGARRSPRRPRIRRSSTLDVARSNPSRTSRRGQTPCRRRRARRCRRPRCRCPRCRCQPSSRDSQQTRTRNPRPRPRRRAARGPRAARTRRPQRVLARSRGPKLSESGSRTAQRRLARIVRDEARLVTSERDDVCRIVPSAPTQMSSFPREAIITNAPTRPRTSKGISGTTLC